MDNRCDFCGRFLSEYYKLNGNKTLFIPVRYGGKNEENNTVTLCGQCASVRGMYKFPKNFIVAVKEGRVFRKNSIQHRLIIIRNIERLIKLSKAAKPVRPGKKYRQEKKSLLFAKTQIGVLSKEIGMAGYIKAKPGQPVYEINDRYVIYLKKEKPITHDVYIENEIRYYKTTLLPYINFC